VTPNLWHSCSRHSLDEHFKGKDPLMRQLFDRYLALVRKCGPVTVYAQKTRIIFQVRVRFAGAVIKKNWIEGGVWLKRRVEHPRFFRIESPTPRDHIHRFRLTKLKEIDDELAEFIREAYAVGCQEHFDAKAKHVAK
jgi:hypothetical protein